MVKAEPHRKECAARSVQVSHRLTASPNFSHPLYCIGAMIRPDCVTRKAGGAGPLRRPPQRTIQYVCGGLGHPLAGHAWRTTHSRRPFRRFVTRRC